MVCVDLAPKFLLGSYPLLDKSRRNAQYTSHNQRMGDIMFLDLRKRELLYASLHACQSLGPSDATASVHVHGARME